MSSKEHNVCTKNGEYCVTLTQFRAETEELSKEEAKIAEEAKQGALEILQDALKKKDKVLMKLPQGVVLNGEEREQFWMKRHAILTEEVVTKLLAELKKVTFKKNIHFCREVTVAYVVKAYEPKTIYLCKRFWKRNRFLEKDSQPGTVIHEVSHLLGATDITYTENILYVGCKGSIVKGSPAHSTANSPSKENFCKKLEKAFWNAKNIQHEFELTINHSKKYVNGKYPCCGETRRYSVCEKSVPDFFHTCNIDKKWEIKKLIIKDLIRRKKSFPSYLRWLHETVEKMGEPLRNVNVTGEVACSRTLPKKEKVPASPARIFMASATFGNSSEEALADSPSPMTGLDRDEVTHVSTNIFKTRSTAFKEKLYSIFEECQHFLDDFERVTGSLSDRGEFLGDCRPETKCPTYLTTLPVFIAMIKEEIESKRDDEQQMHALLTQFHSYMAGVLESTAVLEYLCEHFF